MTLLPTSQRETVLRVWRDTETYSRDLLALVTGVPDEDRRAFDKVLHNWLNPDAEQDENWPSEPLTSDTLDDFWQAYSPCAGYFGTDLEGEVLAYRAQDARSAGELRRVLGRMFEHVELRSDDRVGNFRGFFTCLSDALAHPDFEQTASTTPPVRSVA